MDPFATVSILATIAGAAWKIAAEVALRKVERPTGTRVLNAFAVVVILFAAVAGWHYRSSLDAMTDSLFLGIGLFLAMVFGMFVQVLATNFRVGKPLFHVSASQLIFPLLFSVIVYYPIWAVAGQKGSVLFGIYAAFLNGYFWESVVSSARPVDKPESRIGVAAGPGTPPQGGAGAAS